MIIYFSGTGNSEYIAEAIAKRLEDKTVCVNNYIRENKSGSFESEKPYVFVFPVYLSIAPVVFRNFIEGSIFSGNMNAYFVPTCVGADGSVPNSTKNLCDKMGTLRYMGCQKVCMPQNYVIFFKPFSDEKKNECYKNADTTVDEICEVIKSGGELSEKPASGFEYVCTKLVEKWYNSSLAKTRYFKVSDDCIGCGQCEQGCPTASIQLKNGKPVWNNRVCIHCMACISRCPKQAIEFGRLSIGKERHVCPKYEK